ncbi:MAG: hypothetical protein APF84_08300 [Gracilibacter sp. BRH_c7a]|nr:MAG: hypothetical protein APF84_08300 [Gracilibacter sp. BRH_c7a]
MYKSFYKRLELIIIVSIISLFATQSLIGCSIFKKDSEQQSNPESQNEKIPKPLEEIESSVESIFQTLGAPSMGEKKEGEKEEQEDKNKESETGEEQDQGKDQGQEQEQGKSQGQEQGQEQQQGQEQSQNANKSWQQISQTLDQLHNYWNEYMPEAAQKSPDSRIIDNFSDSLNNLTHIIKDQDKGKAALAANNLHSNIPDFYALYKTQHTGEIKRMAFYTRSCILYSQDNKWTEVDSFMKDLDSAWTFLKSALDKEQLEPVNKLDLSFYELKKVVEQKDSQLINIKGRLTLANIEELLKAIEESDQKGSSNQNKK